jgi:molecular chaperone GrpE
MTKKRNINEQEKDHNTKHRPHSPKDSNDQNSITPEDTSNSQVENTEPSVSAKDEKKEVTADEKLAEMIDKYIRLSAEFDNYRKRTLREKIELTKYAGEDIFKNLIPVVDDFERAMKQLESSQDSVAIKSGIELIYNKFSLFLKQYGVKEIEALNKDFDVDLHEAITKIPASDESMKGKVVDVVTKGYFLNDKVMRFSKVVVGE